MLYINLIEGKPRTSHLFTNPHIINQFILIFGHEVVIYYNFSFYEVKMPFDFRSNTTDEELGELTKTTNPDEINIDEDYSSDEDQEVEGREGKWLPVIAYPGHYAPKSFRTYFGHFVPTFWSFHTQ